MLQITGNSNVCSTTCSNISKGNIRIWDYPLWSEYTSGWYCEVLMFPLLMLAPVVEQSVGLPVIWATRLVWCHCNMQNSFHVTATSLDNNKANLRDLIAATGLVFLLKLDLNPRFFSPCDLEIWWMTPKNNRAPLLCCFKLFASFRSHWWMQTGVTVRKPLIWVKIDVFLSRVTLKFDRWPSKTIGHLFYATSSFVQHFVAIGEFKLELESGNAQSGSNAALFRAVWPWNLTDDLEKQ